MRRYSEGEQDKWRAWLELNDGSRNLGKVQIYEHIDTTQGNRHVPVFIDEQGGLYVGEHLALISKKRIPNLRHNISWGLSHTPFREFYGMPRPYSHLTFARSPVTVHDMHEMFGFKIPPEGFKICYWASYVLHQRDAFKSYIARNGRRLKWVGEWAEPNFRTRVRLYLFP